jgi:hypothetical protein
MREYAYKPLLVTGVKRGGRQPHMARRTGSPSQTHCNAMWDVRCMHATNLTTAVDDDVLNNWPRVLHPSPNLNCNSLKKRTVRPYAKHETSGFIIALSVCVRGALGMIISPM